MCKPINYEDKKYNLLKVLHNVSVDRYRNIMQQMPEKLAISSALWRKWIYLDEFDPYEIPQIKLDEIGQLLNVDPESLKNFRPKKARVFKPLLKNVASY